MERRVGESRRESGSVIDFTEPDELWTDWSARRRRRDWSNKGRAEAPINLYLQVIHFFPTLLYVGYLLFLGILSCWRQSLSSVPYYSKTTQTNLMQILYCQWGNSINWIKIIMNHAKNISTEENLLMILQWLYWVFQINVWWTRKEYKAETL